MNKYDFIRATAKRADITIDAAERIINAALDIVAETVKQGEPVSLKGFGRFEIRERKARGRDFDTGELLPGRVVHYVHYVPADHIRDALRADE